MHDDNAKLNINAQQARRFALSFYSIVSKYCDEHKEAYAIWLKDCDKGEDKNEKA